MWNSGIEFWTAVISAAIGLFKAFKFVQEGEMGIKLRFGKATRKKDGTPKIIPPGFVMLIPFVETLQRHHVRQQTLRLDDQKVMIARGLIFNISAIVIFRVKDIYKALFEIDDLDNSLVDLSMGILRDVLASKDYTDLSAMDKIAEELLSELQEKADEWGVTFIQFKLTNCSPTEQTESLVNMEAGVKLKMQALAYAAKDIQKEIQDLPPSFAAALIGIPLMTSVTNEIHTPRPVSDEDKSKHFLGIKWEDKRTKE